MGEEAGEAGGVAGFEVAGGFDGGEEAEGGSHCGGDGGCQLRMGVWGLERTMMMLKLQCAAF